MTLKELRKKYRLTQTECAKYLEVPLRTYQNYERDGVNTESVKYRYLYEKLEKYGYIDEDHGILTLDEIKRICREVFENYQIEYCYLFGSYARGEAKETSDVDLLVCTEVTGLKFFGLVETLREELKKKVDLLNQEQLVNNFELTNEILRDGIKIC